ncbi:hypothetical protein [Spartinivicinus ruber]|nr:hypothetical protein [Spartinivicinus ruber]
MMTNNFIVDDVLEATCPKCHSTVKRFYFDILGCPSCGHQKKDKENKK